MQNADIVATNPIFRQLTHERKWLGNSLALILATVYFTYIVTIAYDPSALGARMGDALMTWGIAAGAGILCFGFLLTALYVGFANTRLDRLSRRLHEEMQ